MRLLSLWIERNLPRQSETPRFQLGQNARVVLSEGLAAVALLLLCFHFLDGFGDSG